MAGIALGRTRLGVCVRVRERERETSLKMRIRGTGPKAVRLVAVSAVLWPRRLPSFPLKIKYKAYNLQLYHSNYESVTENLHTMYMYRKISI